MKFSLLKSMILKCEKFWIIFIFIKIIKINALTKMKKVTNYYKLK